MLASAFHPQFKLCWIKESEKINIVKEKMSRLVNEKDKLQEEQSSSEEVGGGESSDFSLDCTRNLPLEKMKERNKSMLTWKFP